MSAANSFSVTWKTRGVAPHGPAPGLAGGEFGDAGVPGGLGHRVLVAREDPAGQHRAAGRGADRLGDRGQQAHVLGDEQQAGVGAELAGAERQRPGVPGGDRGRAGERGAGQHDARVDRAELAVEGDGDRALGGDLGQRQAAARRPGEPGCGHGGMLEQPQPGLYPMDQAERPGGSPGGRQRPGDDLGGHVRGDRVPLVRLHHHRAARGERRGGVAAGHGEREREVRRREHGHRADRPVDPPQVRDDALGRGHNGVEVPRCDRGDDPRPPAVPEHGREQPQLAGGAGHLAGEPLAAERGLGVGDRRDLARAGVERVGHGLERLRPPAERGPGRERGHRGGHGRVEPGVGRLGHRLPYGLSGSRVKPLNHQRSW